MKAAYFVDTNERPMREMRHYAIGETDKELDLKGKEHTIKAYGLSSNPTNHGSSSTMYSP